MMEVVNGKDVSNETAVVTCSTEELNAFAFQFGSALNRSGVALVQT